MQVRDLKDSVGRCSSLLSLNAIGSSYKDKQWSSETKNAKQVQHQRRTKNILATKYMESSEVQNKGISDLWNDGLANRQYPEMTFCRSLERCDAGA